jgi:hypothetical protein
VIVLATGLWIKLDATNFWNSRHHYAGRTKLQPIVSSSS